MKQSYITLEKLLNEMSENIPLIKEGDIFETIKTLYPSYVISKKDKNIIIEGIEMTYPIASSKKTKKTFIREKSPLLEIYNELSRGDLLIVKSITNNRIICENISVREKVGDTKINNTFCITKLDILQGNYKLVQRGKKKLTGLLNSWVKIIIRLN